MDGDGDLDLVAGNEFETSKLYKNDGSGGYLTHNQTVVSAAVNNGVAVSAAALTATETVNTSTTRNTSIDYYLSNDGGAH